MKSVTELLREADPLLHESTTFCEERDDCRRAILAEASRARGGSGMKPRSRVTLVVMLGCVMILALFVAEHMWSPRVSSVYAAPVRFEVKLAEDTAAAGLREAKVLGTDRVVYIHPEAIVTNSDISRAYIIHVNGSSQYDVGVEFNPSGKQKIREATAKHVGRPVAILLDGQVVMTATVREPIAESAVISGHLSKAEAARIVRGITATQ